MKVLVVDPAITSWAFAIFDDEDGKLLHSETITYKSKESQESRLYKIFDKLDKVDDIGHVVVERQFVDIMGQIVGVIRAVAGGKNCGSTMFVPSSWRKLLTGKGNATEEMVKAEVLKVYPQMADKSEHEIDTCAIYIAYRGKSNAKQSKGSSRK
jgi:Holliday junction resolvasome RuvABC endonuclease subunit